MLSIVLPARSSSNYELYLVWGGVCSFGSEIKEFDSRVCCHCTRVLLVGGWCYGVGIMPERCEISAGGAAGNVQHAACNGRHRPMSDIKQTHWQLFEVQSAV